MSKENKKQHRIEKPQNFPSKKKKASKPEKKIEKEKKHTLHNPNFKQAFFSAHKEMIEIVDATIYFIRRDYSHLPILEQQDIVMEELNNCVNFTVPRGVIFPKNNKL